MDNHTFEDDLTSTVPRADPQFQDQLEAAFLDRIRQEKQQMFMTAQQKRGVASLRFSLTGLAAVLALVIVGVVALYANKPDPDASHTGAMFQATQTLAVIPSVSTETPTSYPTNTNTPNYTPTSTPSATPYMVSSGTPGYPVPVGSSLNAAIPELRLVYIAAHDIPNGAIVTQADFIPTYWPADRVPSDHLMFVVENVQVTRDIPRWQPILNSDLAISVVQ